MPPVLAVVGSGLAAIGGGSALAGAATVGSIGAGIAGSRRSARAIDTATAAGERATAADNAIAERERAQDVAALNPFIQQGQQNSNRLNDFLGTNPYAFNASDFQTDPGYQFRLDQGLGAVTQSRAVSGLLKSGSALKALNDYAQGQASQEYDAAYNRHQTTTGNYINALGNQQGVGLGAASALAGVGQNYVNNVSANNNNLAETQGNAALAGASQTNNLIGQGINALSYFAGNGGFGQRGSSYGAASVPSMSSPTGGYDPLRTAGAY